MRKADSPVERAHRALMAELDGLSAKRLARAALLLKGRVPGPLAESMMRQLLAGDARFMELPSGRWNLVPPEVVTPIDDTEFVVVDLETTGGRPATNRIIEIGAFRVVHGRVENSFCTLVHPRRSIPLSISYLTGIYDEHVKDAPPFEDVALALQNFIGDAVFVGHNAGFDAGFVDAEFARAGLPPMDNPVVCTLRLSRRLLKGQASHSLGAVADALGIDLKEERHRAPGDAWATARLLLMFLDMAAPLGVDSLEALLRFQVVRPGAWKV